MTLHRRFCGVDAPTLMWIKALGVLSMPPEPVAS
jgi:hypothetical protein